MDYGTKGQKGSHSDDSLDLLITHCNLEMLCINIHLIANSSNSISLEKSPSHARKPQEM